MTARDVFEELDFGEMGCRVFAELLKSVDHDKLMGDSVSGTHFHATAKVGSRHVLRQYIYRIRKFCKEYDLGEVITQKGGVQKLEPSRYSFRANPGQIATVLALKEMLFEGIVRDVELEKEFREGDRVHLIAPGIAKVSGVITGERKGRFMFHPERAFSVQGGLLKLIGGNDE
jgi:hypothetical protein